MPPRRHGRPSPHGRSRRPAAPKSQGPERLQKVLAAAGLGSRRECEELILAGRVEIDRKVVTELGTRADPASQEIRVDGTVLRRPKLVYYAVYKPQGVVSTRRDPAARPRVTDLVPDHRERLFPVGRLDMSSEGLILLTNDGELANRLTHPRYGVPKTYRVLVAGIPTPEVLGELRRGIHLAEGVARAERIQIKSRHKDSAVLEIVLREGRNREIRRILARVGHKVMRLARTAVGPVRLGDLPRGGWRMLSGEEVAALRHAAATSAVDTSAKPAEPSREPPARERQKPARRAKPSTPPRSTKKPAPKARPGQPRPAKKPTKTTRHGKPSRTKKHAPRGRGR